MEDIDAPAEDARNARKDCFITLNERSFRVGQNLHSALQHLRHEDKPRTLWVDAVCIDQDNLYERGRQVAVMDQIYAGASSVLAWQGEADEHTEVALDTIEDICWVVKVQLLYSCAVEFGIPLQDVTSDRILHMMVTTFVGMDESRATTGPFTGLRRSEIAESIGCMEHVSVHIPDGAQSIEDVAAGTLEPMRPLRKTFLSKDPLELEDSPLKANFIALFDFFHGRSYWSRLWIVQKFAMRATCNLFMALMGSITKQSMCFHI